MDRECRPSGAPTYTLSCPVQVFGNSPCIRRVWRSITPEDRTAGKRCRDFSSNDEPRPSPPVGGMRHQATASRPPAASSCRLLARLRDWSRGRRRARSEIARGSTRPARASSDRRDPGRLLPKEVAHARTSRLPLLFSWALWRTVPLGSNCVSRPTRLSSAKCALKALGADFIVFVHARFLG